MATVGFYLDSGIIVEMEFFDNDSAGIAVDNAMVTGVRQHHGEYTTVYPPHRIRKVSIEWGVR